jgi:hypothetical protein
MPSSRPDLQKERGFPSSLSRKKNLLIFKRESTRFSQVGLWSVEVHPLASPEPRKV